MLVLLVLCSMTFIKLSPSNNNTKHLKKQRVLCLCERWDPTDVWEPQLSSGSVPIKNENQCVSNMSAKSSHAMSSVDDVAASTHIAVLWLSSVLPECARRPSLAPLSTWQLCSNKVYLARVQMTS